MPPTARTSRIGKKTNGGWKRVLRPLLWDAPSVGAAAAALGDGEGDGTGEGDCAGSTRLILWQGLAGWLQTWCRCGVMSPGWIWGSVGTLTCTLNPPWVSEVVVARTLVGSLSQIRATVCGGRNPVPVTVSVPP